MKLFSVSNNNKLLFNTISALLVINSIHALSNNNKLLSFDNVSTFNFEIVNSWSLLKFIPAILSRYDLLKLIYLFGIELEIVFNSMLSADMGLFGA